MFGLEARMTWKRYPMPGLMILRAMRRRTGFSRLGHVDDAHAAFADLAGAVAADHGAGGFGEGGGLKDSAPEAFEVGGFGVVGHDRVVVAGAGGGGGVGRGGWRRGATAEDGDEFVEEREAGAGGQVTRRPPGFTQEMASLLRSKYLARPSPNSSWLWMSLGGSRTMTSYCFWF